MVTARALLLLALVAGAAQAHVTVEQVTVPVKVLNVYGKETERDIRVSLYYESGAPKPYPLLVLNHGRSSKATVRAAVTPKPYEAAARWLTGFGFLVAVPVRVGYGATGGDDVEDSGGCGNKQYPPVYLASAAQTLAVLEMLRKRGDTAKDRAVVMGQSFGGTTALTIASQMPAGVQGTINFAGGGGGNPEDRPENPCGQARLRELFAGYGKTARIPTLWIYSANDRYWGPKLPVEWFDAFRAAGGVGEYAGFPPVEGADGHLFFSRKSDLWRPRVQEFLKGLGYTRQ